MTDPCTHLFGDGELWAFPAVVVSSQTLQPVPQLVETLLCPIAEHTKRIMRSNIKLLQDSQPSYSRIDASRRFEYRNSVVDWIRKVNRVWPLAAAPRHPRDHCNPFWKLSSILNSDEASKMFDWRDSEVSECSVWIPSPDFALWEPVCDRTPNGCEGLSLIHVSTASVAAFLYSSQLSINSHYLGNP